ncbi:MAG: hypothetical protein QOI75_5310 [Pseudonocardiales bacterium]|nr:hypothetical protein [Pseudonocardiales bacterium]
MHIRRVVPGDLSMTITDSSVSAAATVPAAAAVSAAAAAMPTTAAVPAAVCAAAMPPAAVPAAIVPTTSVLTPWSRGSVPARRVGVLLLRGYEAPVG